MPDLLGRLERLRGSEKTVGEVGPTLMSWVSLSMETKRKLREKKRTRHNPPSLSPAPLVPPLCFSHKQSDRVQHVSISAYVWLICSSSFSLQFPCLEAYVTYCCNQVGAKALLDQKKLEKRVEHFLRLCQESSFSRKLDLWNFLDLPRSRLVKYPLLLKEIQKCTPADHPDEDTLPDAVSCCPTNACAYKGLSPDNC